MNGNVPPIDRLAGMDFYSTDFKGCGESIKDKNEDFQVFELLDSSISNQISKVQTKYYKIPIYVLEKNNIDSSHAIHKIFQKMRTKLRILGLKDAKAITLQYATGQSSKVIQNMDTGDVKLKLIGFLAFPLKKSNLVGNRFKIRISYADCEYISKHASDFYGIANYYGLQRFGSERLVTHLVGREIIRKNFRAALELYLCYTTKYDSKFSKEIRNKCLDQKNYKSVLKVMPKGMDIERIILSALMEGKSDVAALRSIPVAMRRFFIHSFQSYLFNKCISRAMQDGESLSKTNRDDLCFEIGNGFALGKLYRSEGTEKEKNVVPAIQLAGYGLKNSGGRFEKISIEILKEEKIIPRDFYINELQELSIEGGYRQTTLMTHGFSSDQGKIEFTLPVGAYATTLLREIMKPIDPIKSGF